MAAKKNAPKSGAKKKSPAKKKAAKKKPSAEKKAGKKKSAAKRKSAARKPTASTKKSEDTKAAPKKSAASVASKDVNLGHIFSLRPRVSTTFRQPDFLTARNLLQDESYKNISEAARAVAEKALELTHHGPNFGKKRS